MIANAWEMILVIGACGPRSSAISAFAQGTNARLCDVFTLYCSLVRIVLKVLQKNGSQPRKVTLEIQLRGSHEGEIRGEMDRLSRTVARSPLAGILPQMAKNLPGLSS